MQPLWICYAQTMNPDEIMKRLSEAVDSIDEPAFVLLAIGKDGEAFSSSNNAMEKISIRDRSEIYCGASLCLLSGILEPDMLD